MSEKTDAKLTKEELLKWLDEVRSDAEMYYRAYDQKWNERDKQAYNQLREIMEEHFRDSTGWETILTRLVDIIEKQKKILNGYSEQIAKLLTQQKPQVSAVDVYNYVDRQWKECKYNKSSPESYDVKGMIIEFLKKHGWGVEDD